MDIKKYILIKKKNKLSACIHDGSCSYDSCGASRAACCPEDPESESDIMQMWSSQSTVQQSLSLSPCKASVVSLCIKKNKKKIIIFFIKILCSVRISGHS